MTISSIESDVAEKRTDAITRHRALYSRRNFKPGELIIDFTWSSLSPQPTYLTIQISDNEHGELEPAYLDCINHSCDPNCFFDTERKKLIALKELEEGTELSFFYPSSEWDMDRPFQCLCKSSNCIGTIRGAKHLPEKLIPEYRFTQYIRQRLAKERGL
jgi:SET domain-containing protein